MKLTKGTAQLLVAIVLAGLAAPIVKWLVVHGGKLGVSEPGAISYCNVFFVSSACGGVILLLFSGWRGIRSDLSHAKAATWLLLAGTVTIGGVVAPVLLYYALESTSATNVLLLMRVESVAYAALVFVFFRASTRRMVWVGLATILAGCILLAVWNGGGRIGFGDGMALLGGLVYALGTVMMRSILRDVRLPTMLFVRNLVGAIVFFVVAQKFYGPGHFADAFSADLWVIMLVYTSVVVVLGQVLWFRAIEVVRPGTVAISTTLTPVAGIVFAYLLLAEVPNRAQWAGCIVILAGTAVSRIAPQEHEEMACAPADRCLTGM